MRLDVGLLCDLHAVTLQVAKHAATLHKHRYSSQDLVSSSCAALLMAMPAYGLKKSQDRLLLAHACQSSVLCQYCLVRYALSMTQRCMANPSARAW